MNKTIGMLILIAVVLMGLGWGVRQYGNARVAAQELGTVKEAVSEAVAERKEAVATDARQAREIAVVRRETASVAERGKAKDAEIRKAGCAGDSDPERLRLLNDAINRTNRAIESAGKLHD